MVIDDPDTIIDKAFEAGREAGDAQELPGDWPGVKRRRADAKTRVSVAANYVVDELGRVEQAFPNLAGLSEFHDELLSIDESIDDIRQALGHVSGVRRSIRRVGEAAEDDIGGASYDEVGGLQSRALGRIASSVDDLDESLGLLADALSSVRRLPAVEGRCVVVAGFPNAGKTALWNALTRSDRRVGSYHFTTTYPASAMHGSTTVLDTPPVLHRGDAVNDVERRALAAVRYAADALVVCLSPDFGVERQLGFARSVDRRGVPLVLCDELVAGVGDVGFECVSSDEVEEWIRSI